MKILVLRISALDPSKWRVAEYSAGMRYEVAIVTAGGLLRNRWSTRTIAHACGCAGQLAMIWDCPAYLVDSSGNESRIDLSEGTAAGGRVSIEAIFPDPSGRLGVTVGPSVEAGR